MKRKFIIGPPGTGKTTRLVETYYNRIQKYTIEKIQVISHTNVAADEIRAKILDEKEAIAIIEAASSVSEETEQIASNGISYLESLISKAEETAISIEKTEELIKKIKEQSKEITKSTGTITGISNQTHLLSFNAAIEAARAGEHGRGFAVVADEVRKLAKNSSNNVKEIDDVVKNNNELIGEFELAIQQIIEDNKENYQKIQDISNIVSEILDGAKNVSTSVEKLNRRRL